nr:dihydroxyacetone phosphate acyltransferase [Leptinotarsa decemlineata]XP_023017058.1 dihydroxyacetone phosphate acyltransferase [Leptinotarsa decemlineata]
MDIRQQKQYENFLEPRRQEISNFLWISKHWDPKIAFKQGSRRPTPASHKEAVLQSPRIQELLNELSRQQNIPKSQLEKQIRTILDEIGYDRKMKVVRWLGLALTKICMKVLSGLYINTAKVQEIKSVMGNCPVIFVPSHRSYGDFILMAYLTFTYDVEIPAVAAGMDFHGMWGMGTVLRDTGAFFMRRSYNDDSLYWTTFKEYVYQLVTKADVPIEFFLEGTRSRSNKSLPPKFGLLSMILKALFLSQVPDILFVPISINYDRILEENLFTYELLGVPKPKETTSGFFKSLKIIKEHFGDIFIHVDEAISAKKYFEGKIQRTSHNVGPIHQQDMTEEEKNLIPQFANEIVHRQQKNNVLTVFNLIALVINNNYANQRVSFTLDELTKQVMWMKQILETLGCFIHTTNLEKSIKDSFIIHSNLIRLDSENKVCLISNEVTQEKISPLKLKGHALSDKTMTYSVPFIMLQIYVNPSLHYFVDVAILAIILNKRSSLIKDELFQTYYFLRSLFAKEFIIFTSLMGMEFETAVNNGINFGIIECTDSGCHYQLGSNNKLTEFLLNALEPFQLSYFITFSVLQGASLLTDEKTILANVQQVVENAISINKEFIHPYCLNLDTLTNCLSTLCSMNIMKKSRRDNKNMYSGNSEKLRAICERFEIYIPNCHMRKTTVLNLTLQNKL